jgi:hypothetical protein
MRLDFLLIDFAEGFEKVSLVGTWYTYLRMCQMRAEVFGIRHGASFAHWA